MSEKELEKMFESAGIPLSKQTLSHIYQDLGPKMGKGVSIEQFQTFISENYGSRDGDNYEAIFKLYDRKNRGYFDLTDYKEAVTVVYRRRPFHRRHNRRHLEAVSQVQPADSGVHGRYRPGGG